MMRSTLYLLVAVLFVLVTLSVSADEKPRNDDIVTEPKRRPSSMNKNSERERKRFNSINDDDEDEHDDMEENSASLASYANNRYLPMNHGEGNHRPRSRWQGPSSSSLAGSFPPPPPPSQSSSQFDDFLFGNDALRSGFGNFFQGSSPAMSYENNHKLSNGPACHSLIDPQYAIFSDICGAVPQARYALPNPFGHRERWQVAQVLSSVMGSSMDASCTRSLRLLLCPVLFPPCPTKHEPTPVLPCQSYCRTVKARCANPALDFLPCEALPQSSDICPTNQAYGSFIPQNSFPSMPQNSFPSMPQQSFPMNVGPQSSRQFPSLQSLLSSSALQSGLNGGHPLLGSSQQALSAAQTLSPSMLFNNGPYANENPNPMMMDFRQAAKYPPFTRSSPETRSTPEVRPQNEGQNSMPPRGPVVKA